MQRLSAVLAVVLLSRKEAVQGFHSPTLTTPSATQNAKHIQLSSTPNDAFQNETVQERIHRMRSGRLTEEEKRRFLETTLGDRYGSDGATRQLSPAKVQTNDSLPTTSILQTTKWTTDNVIATRNSNIPSSQLEKDRIKREWVNRILDPDRFKGYAQAKAAQRDSSDSTSDDAESNTEPASTTAPASICMGPPGLRSSRSTTTPTAERNAPTSPQPHTREQDTTERPRPSSPPEKSPFRQQRPVEPAPAPKKAAIDQHREWMEENYPRPDPTLSLRDAAAEHAAWMDHKKEDHIHAIDILRRKRKAAAGQAEEEPRRQYLPALSDEVFDDDDDTDEDRRSRRRPDSHPEWSAEEKSKRWGIDLTGLQ